MSRAGTQIDSEILLVKFIVKIIHFFRRHSKLRTDKIVEVYFPDYEELYYHSFDLIYLHLLLYVVKQVASQKTFFENFQPRSTCQSMKKYIRYLLILHTETSDTK